MLDPIAKEKFLAGIAIDLRAALVRAAPFKTGTLANSLHFQRQAEGNYAISAVSYSQWVEYGSAPHLIKPVNAKALHWKAGGKDVFATEVRHPGTLPNPFIRRTLKNEIARIIKNNVNLHLITPAV